MFNHLVEDNLRQGKKPRHVVAIDRKCDAFDRTWVLSELVQAESLGGKVEQKFYAFNKESMEELLGRKVNINDSETTDPADKSRIIEKAEETVGIDTFNNRINSRIARLAKKNMKEVEKVCILLIGNKGVGTKHIKKYMMDDDIDKNIMALTGLSNTHGRKEAAQAINNALEKKGKCKIFFIVTLEGGRVRPEDTETISLVSQTVNIRNRYTIIINKATPLTIHEVKKEDCMDTLMRQLLPDEMERGNVVCVAEKKCDDEEHVLTLQNLVIDAPYIIVDEITPIPEETVEERLRIRKEDLRQSKQDRIILKDIRNGRICPEDAVDFEVKDGITKIEVYAFIDCGSLKTIRLPKSIEKIGRHAFENCYSLKTIDLPPVLTMLGPYAFNTCSSLKTINLPPSLTTLDLGTFQNCLSLETIVLPSSLTMLGDGAFLNCSSLHTIDLPPSLITLGDGVFNQCGSLEEISIQGPISLIPMKTFNNCCRLKRVVLPESIQSIEEDAFRNCASLLKFSLPNSVESIHTSAFEGCFLIQFENSSIIDSIVENGGVHPYDVHKQNPWHEDNYGTYRSFSIEFKHGRGATNGFSGVTQKGYGPEMCGISLEQLMVLKQHPLYHRTGKNGKSDYLMRDFVQLIKLITAGTGMGYSLLINKNNPLKAKVYISHAWDEPIKDFVEAIVNSGEKGPFYICSMAIHQNDDKSKGITISEQLGEDLETGPFETVLKNAYVMMAVVTHVCDINTRLWCVYDMHLATCNSVPVKICAYISPDDLQSGLVQEDVCVASAEFSVDTFAARCGIPGQPQSSDEIMIREMIDKSENGFNGINKSIEEIRLSYLAKYPVNDIHAWYRKDAIRKIKKAIECILCVNTGNNIKTYDEYLRSERLNDDEDKNFKAWSVYIQDKLM